MAIKKILLSLLLILVISSSNALYVKAQESIDLINIEASVAKELLPKDLSEKTTAVKELNSLILEGNESELKRLKKFIVAIDKPLKHVEIEVKLIEFKKGNLRNIRFLKDTLGINSISGVNSFLDLFPAPGLSPFSFLGGTANPFASLIKGPVDTGIQIGNIAKGLSVFDFSLDDWSLFNKTLSFLETKGVTQTHAYPKIVTIAGRPATININQHNNVVLGSATRLSEFGVGNIQKLDSIKAGTSLSITPTVSKENLITNKIIIDVSENSLQRTIQSSVVVPTTTFRREINTDIQVRSGQTVAIGGLLLNSEDLNKRGLPFITSLPVIGDLLSNRRTERNKTELIVFITPRILELKNIEVKNTEKYKEVENKLLNYKNKK